jgi:alanine racemase
VPSAELTIRSGALSRNWQRCAQASSTAACAGVIKADGYGLGVGVAFDATLRAGCNTWFVAHLSEAIALRQHMTGAVVPGCARVFVLNGLAEGETAAFDAHDLIPVLNSLEQLSLWQREGAGRPAALQVDTAMGRLGISMDQVDDAGTLAQDLNLCLIMSHLACGSTPEHPLNRIQRQRFLEAATVLPPAPLSLAASAGIFLGPDYHFDLTRPGIALYGGAPLDDAVVPLEPVAVLRAPVLQVRTLGPGDTVGYGATWEADRRKSIATVALGYADGFLRAGSNRGFGVLAGAICPIVGRVSMDLITLDVSGVGRTVVEGDWIEFLGPAAPIDAQAQACGTISYELLTGLGRRFTRTVTE